MFLPQDSAIPPLSICQKEKAAGNPKTYTEMVAGKKKKKKALTSINKLCHIHVDKTTLKHLKIIILSEKQAKIRRVACEIL